MVNQKNLIGGSPASLYVMSATCPQAAADVQYLQPTELCLQTSDIVNNYSIVYKTTGGGKISTTSVVDSIRTLLRRIIDNRVFDIYLKYMGIKTLTPSLLVPFALILGKEPLLQVMKYYKDHDREVKQTGGNKDIPIIDNVLIGNYLKLSGLTKLNFTPATLVPLGLIMIIYDLLLTKKDIKIMPSGNVEIPKKYFKFISPVKQTGGLPNYHNSTIPPNMIQWGQMEWNGQDSNLTQFQRGNVFQNNELQLNSSNNDYINVSDITTGVSGNEGPTNLFNQTYSQLSDTYPTNTLPTDMDNPGLHQFPTDSQAPNSPQIWPDMQSATGINTHLPIPKTMAAGGRKKKKN